MVALEVATRLAGNRLCRFLRRAIRREVLTSWKRRSRGSVGCRDCAGKLRHDSRPQFASRWQNQMSIAVHKPDVYRVRSTQPSADTWPCPLGQACGGSSSPVSKRFHGPIGIKQCRLGRLWIESAPRPVRFPAESRDSAASLGRS